MINFFSIVWRILVNLATGAVILAMFHIANSPFEKISISAWILIYVLVINISKALGWAFLEKSNIDLTRYIAIASSLHLNTEIEKEAQKEYQEEIQKFQTITFITSAFNMLFWLIAIGNLVYAITT